MATTETVVERTETLTVPTQALKEEARPAVLDFDPAALREKYLAERDRRLQNGGINQYRLVEDSLAHYIKDPYCEPFERDPIDLHVDVLIVGGGYGAQLVAVRLLEQGITNFRLIEKGGDFGGTWYWNRYPGAQCDIESYIYMPLLEEIGYVPVEKYTRAKELLKHAKAIGQKFSLYEKTLFQTEVHSLHWNDSSNSWSVETSRKDNIKARFVVPASGPLHRPKMPGLAGIESFKGHSFHSSRWDYGYTGGDPTGKLSNLSDKVIGIIGTGATAVQIVPHLGASAKQLYVFQRTPSSIDVRNNTPTDPEWEKSLKPGWQQSRMDNFNILVNGGYQDTDLVNDGWTDILRNIIQRPDPKADPASVDLAALAAKVQLADYKKMNSVRARVDSIVEDPRTAESLKPWYNQFCKRPCFHDEYLKTFNRPNVTLVDTHGKGVEAITPAGVVANGTEYHLDCLIYATGFELATDWSHRSGMEIYGRNGLTTTEKWKDGASTLHGWTSRGFPNCFFVQIVQAALTPNFIHVTNEQAKHIAYVIKTCGERGIQTVEPTADAEEKWVQTIVRLGGLRRNFFKECTPGYYNSEGEGNMRTARNAPYGAGATAFLDILTQWREKGELDGLDVSGGNTGVNDGLKTTAKNVQPHVVSAVA